MKLLSVRYAEDGGHSGAGSHGWGVVVEELNVVEFRGQVLDVCWVQVGWDVRGVSHGMDFSIKGIASNRCPLCC